MNLEEKLERSKENFVERKMNKQMGLSLVFIGLTGKSRCRWLKNEEAVKRRVLKP
jgi:hypothetical protein